MIDFRYHLVSLISVFLALAVGIVLGAGPLREQLGTQLAGQVEQLRTEKDDLRASNDGLVAANDQLGSYITQTAPALVAGTLSDRTVGIITDDSSTRTSVEQLSALVADAGGTAPVRVTLGEALWADGREGDRTSALAAVRSAAPDLEPVGTTDSERLASVVVELLTAPSGDLPDAERAAALDALTSARMITLDGTVDGPVDGLVYASAAPGDLADPTDTSATAASTAQTLSSVQVSLLQAVVDGDVPTVVAAATPGADDTAGIIRTARADSRFATLSTADGFQRPDGPPVAVLALAEQFRGGEGSYGTATGAQARIPAQTAGSGAGGDSGDSGADGTSGGGSGGASDGGGR